MSNIKEINELIKLLPDTTEVSDGYHTFGELYEHRCLLFIMLCNMSGQGWGGDNIYKTRKNFDKQEWEGWFILTMNNAPKFKQISYHIPNKYWDLCDCKEEEYNYNYDGHTSNDVLERMKSFYD